MTIIDPRTERHIAFLERLLDNTLEELDKYKDIHERQERLQADCTELMEKYNNLLEAYLKLEESYVDLVCLNDEGGMN